MTGQLLKIKTIVPPLDKSIVPRKNIIERLDADLCVGLDFSRQLTLLSAPAGYGKTTLVREWLENKNMHCAWVSIDEADNDVTRFWMYIITALQADDGAIGKGALALLQSSGNDVSSQQSSPDFLIPLLNEMFLLEKQIILVLDDYHLIHNSDLHKHMIFFIENMPPKVHLAITTRSDPPWPLSKWRARNAMLDIRLNTLSFTETETDVLFAKCEGLRLNDRQRKALFAKTEGWIAGLKLAALSLAATQDQDTFIEQFTGSNRHILHFLIEEVFSRQTGTVQAFLLKTSILTRFCADLCDAVTRQQGSAAMITQLETINLFVIPLDDQGIWYRYHPLFADVLAIKLKSQQPDQVASLYNRAGQWFLEHGEPGEAARQMISGKLTDQAGQIIHDNYDEILKSEGPSLLYVILHHFPDSLKMKYPRLMAHMTLYILIHQGQAEAKRYLDLADTLTYPEQQEQKEYEGMLFATKAYYAIFINEFELAEKYARTALSLLSAENHYWRMNTAIYLGDAKLFSGQAKQALDYYQQAQVSSRKTGNLVLQMNTGFKTAYSLYKTGRLKEAEALVHRLLSEAKAAGLSSIPRAGLLWTLYGELLREKGKLDEAGPAVERGILFSEPEKPCLGWNYLFEADLFYSQKQYEAALRTLKEIELLHLEVRLPSFITFPAAVRKARVMMAEGQLSAARDCLSEAGLSETGLVTPGHEEGYLVLAQIMMAEESRQPPLISQILAKVSEQVEVGDCKGLLLEAKLLAAQLAMIENQTKRAKHLLTEALEMGSGLGYYQIFSDRKDQLISIIDKLPAARSNIFEGRHLSDRLVKLLLGSELRQKQEETISYTVEAAVLADAGAIEELVEKLSARELEILALISQGLSNQDIAEKLFLTLGTVKWHTSNIYGKLGVRGRTQAVARARQAKLIN